MDPTLPQPVRLSLERALALWRRWSPAPAREPAAIEVLGGGRSNTSVRVGDGERQWVVRIDGIDPARLGLSRNAEWRCLANASGAGLAPRAVYRNPELAVLVCEYQLPDEQERISTPPGVLEEPEAVAELLRRIHMLPAIRHRLDPLARARRYLRLAGHGELPVGLVRACDRLAQSPASPRLCHNDPLRPNRLFSGGRLLALDWEYAAMGDPLFDLAAVIEGDGLCERDARTLHEAWSRRSPDRAEQRRLADQREVYLGLSELWERIPR
jgi:aminoglycoside phosphotransferase (APT) family kinase protein